MKVRQLVPSIIYSAIVLLSLGHFAPSSKAQNFTKLEWVYQPVDVSRSDGGIFKGEFAGEFLLFSDGRANGGFGLWNLGEPNALSLYHVTEGRNNGPYWSFKGISLSPEPSDSVTINVRVGGGSVPTGSVTFIIDGVNGLHLSFTTRAEINGGCSGGRCTDPPPQFGLIRAEPQTVLVQTFTGNYTANFENVALVLSGGNAIGSLVLSSPDGSLQRIRIKGGEIDFRNGEAQVAWLRGQTIPPSGDPLPVLLVIANRDFLTEPCRIYDIAGTQVHANFEAHTWITGLAVDPH
jgi:hypothetical protein